MDYKRAVLQEGRSEPGSEKERAGNALGRGKELRREAAGFLTPWGGESHYELWLKQVSIYNFAFWTLVEEDSMCIFVWPAKRQNAV